MPPFDLKVSINAERTSLKIDFPKTANMTAVDLEEFIQILARLRPNLTPAPSPHAPPIVPDRLIHDPRWSGHTCDPAEEGAHIQIQHPSFGWLQFRLPRREVGKLASWLQTAGGVLETPPTGVLS